jgi:hypothetical protein
MPLKIYVRERIKVKTKVKEPRFRVVAVTGTPKDTHLKLESIHLRKTELEQIAKDVDAGIVYLEPIPEEERGKMKESA